ncbi:MAG: orotate phosphoribosyltransferase [Actinobacteria bacterium]|nr:orotate phosphoribosyltransferase [Actinomycetota bacterium]MDI6831822.1 orotate phosphoribosyltransferase [Actinomycetota bacterium]
MNPAEVMEIFEREGAVQRGHFLLTSGLHSDTYVQCALVLQHPHLAESLAGALAKGFEKKDIDLVVSPALGGIIIGYMVALSLGRRMLFAERREGKLALRRGQAIPAGAGVLVVEDVITTGGSVGEVMELVRGAGAEVRGLAALIERGGDRDFGVPKKVLLQLEAKAWDPAECPLCREGVELVTPGSRYGG